MHGTLGKLFHAFVPRFYRRSFDVFKWFVFDGLMVKKNLKVLPRMCLQLYLQYSTSIIVHVLFFLWVFCKSSFSTIQGVGTNVPGPKLGQKCKEHHAFFCLDFLGTTHLVVCLELCAKNLWKNRKMLQLHQGKMLAVGQYMDYFLNHTYFAQRYRVWWPFIHNNLSLNQMKFELFAIFIIYLVFWETLFPAVRP